MPEFHVKSAQELVQQQVDITTANNTKINDFSPGSKIRSVFAAAANVVATLYYEVFEGLKQAIEDAVYDAFNFPLDPGARATTALTFTRANGTTTDYPIPVGTLVSTSDGAVEFVTTETVIILAGNSTVTAKTQASEIGTKANVKSGRLTTLKTKPVGVGTVTNAADVINGTDPENRDGRKRRFRDYVAALSRGTKEALVYGATRVNGVVTAEAIENPQLTVLVSGSADTVYTDISYEANMPYGATTNLTPTAVNDALYIGSLEKFKGVWFQLAAGRTGGAGTWEYWNGVGWLPLTVTDNSNGMTTSAMLIFTPPTDWLARKVNNVFLFWVRWRVTTTLTTPATANHLFATPPPGYVDLYIQDGAAAASAQLKTDVAASVNNYRGHGITVNVLAPTIRSVDVTIRLLVDPAYDRTIVVATVRNGVTAYLNGFQLSDDLYLANLTNEVMRLGKAAITTAKLDAPLTDIFASGGEIMRPGNIVVTADN